MIVPVLLQEPKLHVLLHYKSQEGWYTRYTQFFAKEKRIETI